MKAGDKLKSPFAFQLFSLLSKRNKETSLIVFFSVELYNTYIDMT